MEKVIELKQGKYHGILVKKRCAMTLKASCYETKARQEINGQKVKKSHDVWFPAYLPGGALGHFEKSIGVVDAVYVHESIYSKLKFIEV